jgi:hypothetical protein
MSPVISRETPVNMNDNGNWKVASGTTTTACDACLHGTDSGAAVRHTCHTSPYAGLNDGHQLARRLHCSRHKTFSSQSLISHRSCPVPCACELHRSNAIRRPRACKQAPHLCAAARQHAGAGQVQEAGICARQALWQVPHHPGVAHDGG